MKTLIIYGSVFGNTAQAANFLADTLGTEVVIKPLAETVATDISVAERIIVATPTHAGRASQPWQNFLKFLPGDIWQGKRVAVFSTGLPPQGQNFFLKILLRILGYAAAPTLALLLKKGALLAGEPLNLMVASKQGPLLPGELERLSAWALKLK